MVSGLKQTTTINAITTMLTFLPWQVLPESHTAMSASAKLMVWLIARGVRDSVMGALKVHRLDQDVRDEPTSDSTRRDEPLSALARRRFDHLRHTERKQNRWVVK